jgi:membrane protein DedA with SNARE-associated domain
MTLNLIAHSIAQAQNVGATCGSSGYIDMFTTWIVEIIDKLGVVGVGIIVLLENMIPIIPSEIVMPLAGFTIARGSMNFVAVIAITTVCSVLGALFIYWVSRSIGLERIRHIADKLPLTSSEDVDKAIKWFQKFQGASVLIARCVPVVRTLISIPAGLNKMGMLSFCVLTAIGSTVWNCALLVAGFYLGSNWCEVIFVLEDVQHVVIIGVVLLVVGYIAFKVYKQKKNPRQK